MNGKTIKTREDSKKLKQVKPIKNESPKTDSQKVKQS